LSASWSSGTDAIRLTGNEFGQFIVGNAGQNYLSGGGGNDVFRGEAGNDTLDGGAGNDTFYVEDASDKVIEAAGGGYDTVLASANYMLAAGQHIEVLGTTLTGTVHLAGNEFAQRINGNDGTNTLL
ncbi:calcium-binding protein, partial [Rhizobiaceae sp. 2RAB30]